MKDIAKNVRHFLVSEDGPTAVEYALMLALIVLTCLFGIRQLGQGTNQLFSNVADSFTD